MFIWDKVFKNGPSKICGRQPFKILKAVFHKILLGPFLNTLPHLILGKWKTLADNFSLMKRPHFGNEGQNTIQISSKNTVKLMSFYYKFISFTCLSETITSVCFLSLKKRKI